MMDYDVIVVGAGPAGSMAAKHAALNGAKTLLLEEHGQVGSPVSCTGHISRRALEECELGEGSFINKRIRGAFVYAPNNRYIVLDKKQTIVYVVERKILDREMARRAVNAGAEIMVSTRAEGLRAVPGGLSLKVSGADGPGEISASVIIGADGVKSKISRAAGLGNLPHVCSGIQVEAAYEPRDPEFVEMFSGSRYAPPPYFAWAVPTAGDCCRVGLLADEHAHEYLRRLLTEHEIVSKKARSSVDLIMGGVPVGTLKRTVTDHVMIVGDAAGQVKPVSYGGIYTGTRSARIAGEVAAKAALCGDASSARLMEYERRWRADIGRELMLMMRFRKMYSRMTDDDLNEALALLDNPDIAEVMTRYGDIDRPSQLAFELLKLTRNKGMWRLMGLLAKMLL